MTSAIGGTRAPEDIDDILLAVIAETEAARRRVINTIGAILSDAIARLQAEVNENKKLLAERVELQKQRTELDRIHTNAASHVFGQSGMVQLTSQFSWVNWLIQTIDSPPYVRSDCPQWASESYVSLQKQMQVAMARYNELMAKNANYKRTGFPSCFQREVVEKNCGLS